MGRITDRPDMTSAVDRGRKASTQTKLSKSEISGLWPFSVFVSDLVRNPKVRFSHDTAHIMYK